MPATTAVDPRTVYATALKRPLEGAAVLWEGMAEDSREMAALVLVELEIARVAVGATLEMVLRIILCYVYKGVGFVF